MAFVADDEPPSIDELRQFQTDGRAWVWADAGDRPIASLLARVVDGEGAPRAGVRAPRLRGPPGRGRPRSGPVAAGGMRLEL